jgi:deoxycytidylate deaminase
MKLQPLLYATRLARERDWPGVSNYFVVAVIAKRSRVVSFGYNKPQTHPKSKHEYKMLHAEMDAIFRSRESLKDSTIYVVRTLNDGTYGCSKPCEACAIHIAEAGISSVVYISRNGDLLEVK